MNEPVESAAPVNLDNCEREPIHIPGRIQSHGALVAFSMDGLVTHRSANVTQLLGGQAPVLGQKLAQTCFGEQPEMLLAIRKCLENRTLDAQPFAMEATIGGKTLELVGHRIGRRVVLELEPLEVVSSFGDHAFQGHRALARLRHLRGEDSLLQAAVEEVRALTGFDRVMAYRFRHDDSGDVVAEAVTDALEPFIGRRYPASDIPAQARRLYVLNTLRYIVDVNSETVPVETGVAGGAGPEAAEPLDMSYCVLRSVSPIHIEYLQNMGVAASMSISVVINGKLWGMLACHHMTPRFVPHTVRSACDVLAQVLAAKVQGEIARTEAQRTEVAAAVRTRALEALLHKDEGIFALAPYAADMAGTMNAGALFLAERGRLFVWGDLAQNAARALVRWLETTDPSMQLVSGDRAGDLPEELRELMGKWCGFLALRVAATHQGWLVFLRLEQIETIAWGGRPEKEYTHGPMGPRLTPRGSFDVWRETVRGSAEPWGEVDRGIANGLLTELLRAYAARTVDVERARAHLLSMLGQGMNSDQAVSGSPAEDAQSASRLQRLVASVLDASRLQTGSGLALRMAPLDLAQLANDIIDRVEAAHPGVRTIREIPRSLMMEGDAERLCQVLDTLLANARQYGAHGEAVLVQLNQWGDSVTLEVSNMGEAIDTHDGQSLFDPFRIQPNKVNTGLGLGLYIAQHIARGHGGDISYTYADPYVVFSVRLPLQQQGSGR
jgi:chemotaxis family two-component system sensor kinase Cph1